MPKKKAEKTTKKPTHSHASYEKMIIKALGNLTERRKRKGATVMKIREYITDNYDVPETRFKSSVKRSLDAMLEAKKVRRPGKATMVYRLTSWDLFEKPPAKKKKKRKSLKAESKVKKSTKKRAKKRATKSKATRKKAVAKARKTKKKAPKKKSKRKKK